MKTLGLHHVALNVFDVEKCASFYTKIFNMTVQWHPDPDNIYLTSGTDNLALHKVEHCERERKTQRLDHIGFFVESEQAVDEWYQHLQKNNVKIIKEPKLHRDGTKSLYCADPEGTVVQVIYMGNA